MKSSLQYIVLISMLFSRHVLYADNEKKVNNYVSAEVLFPYFIVDRERPKEVVDFRESYEGVGWGISAGSAFNRWNYSIGISNFNRSTQTIENGLGLVNGTSVFGVEYQSQILNISATLGYEILRRKNLAISLVNSSIISLKRLQKFTVYRTYQDFDFNNSSFETDLLKEEANIAKPLIFAVSAGYELNYNLHQNKLYLSFSQSVGTYVRNQSYAFEPMTHFGNKFLLNRLGLKYRL